MLQVFNKSSRGYSHISSEKPCQDFSASYKDNERIIITCCDGHGGEIYVRSQDGSRFASDAVLNVFKRLTYKELNSRDSKKLIDKIRLSILVEWNNLVNAAIREKSPRKSELLSVSEFKRDVLIDNPIKMYGTTLTGAMLINNKLVVVGIGDTEVLGIRRGQLIKLLEGEDDPAGNITFSMCEEDAFSHLRVDILDWKNFDGIMLCTDGMSAPYQSYENFTNSMVRPVFLKVIDNKNTNEIEDFVERVASKLGIGDDVSLSFIFNDQSVRRYYK